MSFRSVGNPRAERLSDLETARAVQHRWPPLWEALSSLTPWIEGDERGCDETLETSGWSAWLRRGCLAHTEAGFFA